MRALAETAVHTVESTLDGNVHIFLVNLAVRASILGVASASSVVAPPGIPAIVRASSKAAVQATEAWLAPANAIQAQTVVGAVAQTHGNLAVRPVPLGAANACSVVALPVGQSACIPTLLHRAVEVGPWLLAFAPTVAANSVPGAIVRA